MGLFEHFVNQGRLCVVWGDNLKFLSTQQLCNLQANLGLWDVLSMKRQPRI